MTHAETVRNCRDKVYQLSHSGKLHIDPNCKYLRHRDDIRRLPVDSLPDWRINLCEWCESYLEKQYSSMNPSSPCDRCGKSDVAKDVCDECHQQIRLGR